MSTMWFQVSNFENIIYVLFRFEYNIFVLKVTPVANVG